MKKKVLIYAFGSWGEVSKNVSEEVLEKLEIVADKLVLPVKFASDSYQDMTKKDYDVIIGLGHYPSGREIRIEQFAYNSYGTRVGGYKEIEASGRETVKVDLEMNHVEGSRLTNGPGKFVCNYSMYKIMRIKGEGTKFAFLHIPKQMNIDRAVEVISTLLAQVGVK